MNVDPKDELKGESRCAVQEQLIYRLWAENARLRRRNEILQRMVNSLGLNRRRPTRRDQIAAEAHSVFQPTERKEQENAI
ncbi:MAG: hypothetical protein LC676_10940 [Loktanella sp.]|nr:hypothetical protein [Loktanella sp.]